MSCSRCGDGFDPHDKIVNSQGELWHPQCFVWVDSGFDDWDDLVTKIYAVLFSVNRCAQCFRPFPDGLFYEFEGRKYCEHDFQVLFAPCCGKCGEFVIGRVIKAMSASWHPACFCCAVCNKELADRGFVRNRNRALCHECNAADKAVLSGRHICFKCQYVKMW